MFFLHLLLWRQTLPRIYSVVPYNSCLEPLKIWLNWVCLFLGKHFIRVLCICIEQLHENIAQGKKVTLEFKAMVNFGAPWPRHRPQGTGEVYQCWWCVGVTEPDWQLLSACSLSVIGSSHVPTPCTYRAPTTWLYAFIYSQDKTMLSMRIRRQKNSPL